LTAEHICDLRTPLLGGTLRTDLGAAASKMYDESPHSPTGVTGCIFGARSGYGSGPEGSLYLRDNLILNM
jgi:hypothetical protein